MNPQTQFCHNLECPARGQVGQGNIRVHSHVEQRYRCTTCGQTFAATKGTPLVFDTSSTLVLDDVVGNGSAEPAQFAKFTSTTGVRHRALPAASDP